MARACSWGSVLNLVAGLAMIGCGPGEGAGDGGSGTETETGTGTGGTTGGVDDGSATVTASASATMTASASASATMTASATMSAGSDSADDGPADTSHGVTGDPTGEDATAGTDGSCPPGGTGCPCDIGSTCDGDLECVDGVCVEPPQCDQPEGEPNDDEASAVPLEAATCGEDAQTMDAALFGDDTDWYIFELMGGQPFCFTNATAAVTMQDIDVEVCIYAVCPEGGQPNTDCGFGSGQDQSESPDGHLGCCDTGSAFFDNAVCDFAQTPPISVEVSVHADTGRECVPYQFEWSY